MIISIERLLEMRVELAQLAGSTRADFTLTAGNQLKDYADPFPAYFVFNKLLGVIEDGFVCWGGMGVHLESIGGRELRQAIKDQTGY